MRGRATGTDQPQVQNCVSTTTGMSEQAPQQMTWDVQTTDTPVKNA